ncbi:MAG: outer membrane lipoprotein-sorting protein [Bdellovibrio sp.]
MKISMVLSCLLLISYAQAACDLDGPTVMKKQLEQNRIESEREVQEVVLLDVKTNTKEKRGMKTFTKRASGENEKSLLTFTEPKEIKGVAVLNWNESGQEDQWLYSPDLKKLQRIAKGSKKNYFMGTDFTFADLEGEKLKNNKYSCVKETSCGKGDTCYEIEALPVDDDVKESYGYSKRILWIEKKNLKTLRIEFYDLGNKRLKFLENPAWAQYGKAWKPTMAVMTREGEHKTFIRVTERQVGRPIDDEILSQRYLQKEMHIQ